EMLRLLERIANGDLVSADASQQMIAHLYACQDGSKLARGLPPAVKFAHKTGAVARSRCDAGLIDSPSGRIAICVLTSDIGDESWGDDNAADIFCGEVARAVYEHFNPPQLVSDQPPPALSAGAQGELVEMLQRTLNARLSPSPELSVDGDFGPQTEGAVEQFQRQEKLDVTGR